MWSDSSRFQAEGSPSNMAASSSGGGGGGAQKNGKVISTVTDSADQPKLKGQGKKRTRFSIKRHLQKHGLAQADSVSSVESADESQYYS